MEFESWWLLALPLFFSLGWLAARVDIRQLLNESRSLPKSYLKGVNFLLNEQPDKALEAFSEAVAADPDTVDLHFGLGGLFRKRGEVARAIRIHQRLVERPDVPAQERLAALFELAQDYLKGGMLDRAEEALRELTKSEYGATAWAFLRDLYVQEKDWQRAVDAARALEQVSHQPQGAEIAHFYCELAEVAGRRGEPAAALQYLEEALLADRQSVRASILAGEMAARADRHEDAIGLWRRVETQRPEYTALIAERLMQSFTALGRVTEGAELLRHWAERSDSPELWAVLYQTTLAHDGLPAAYRLAHDRLQHRPSLQVLDRALESQLMQADTPDRPYWQRVRELVRRYNERLVLYHCGHCGYRAQRFYWHCPACGRWDSFPPSRTEP